MSTMKKLIKSAKQVAPVVKRVGPVISNITSSVDLIENASAIAKPLVDDARTKNIEKSKKIEATQSFDASSYTIAIEKAGVSVTAETEAEAMTLFIERLEYLRDHKILNADKKIRKEQTVLIEKLKLIKESECQIRDYIYRTEIDLERQRQQEAIKEQNAAQKKRIRIPKIDKTK